MSSEGKGGNEWPMDWEHAKPTTPIILSIVIAIVWLVFILFYALFWSNSFSLFQNIVVTIVSLAIAALVIGLTWVVWGMNRWQRWMKS
jgi:hypothetical protein